MTPDQAALLRKAYSSLHAAQLLSRETLFDFSVSRAYYTMFYVAEALLLGHGLSFSKHSAVLAAFGERLTKPGFVPPEFHKYLLDGGDSRHVGDYDLGPGLSAAEAAEQVRRAQEFLDLARGSLAHFRHQARRKHSTSKSRSYGIHSTEEGVEQWDRCLTLHSPDGHQRPWRRAGTHRGVPQKAFRLDAPERVAPRGREPMAGRGEPSSPKFQSQTGGQPTW